MAVTIQLRRDIETNMNSVTPAQGELLLATDTHKAVIGDGSGDTFQAMVTANKFFHFEDGDGGRVFGGNDANKTITVRGGSSQTNPIFKVTTNNTSNSIVEIYDETQLVKIDATHGATGDKTLLLKAKASQTGSVIEVQDSDSGTRFKVLEDGQTTITPNDTTSPSLDVVGSGGSQSNGILRVLDNDGSSHVLTVKSDGIESEQTVTVDGGSIIAQVENTAASNVTITASATDTDKVVTVDGNSGTENFSVTAGGAVTAEGKGTFADAEIDVTGRTLSAASVLRQDEVGTGLQGVASTASTSSFPVGAFRAWAKIQTPGAGSETITMDMMGLPGDGNRSMSGAPDGVYVVLGWGWILPNSASASFEGCFTAEVNHTQGVAETVATLPATNVGGAGFIFRKS